MANQQFNLHGIVNRYLLDSATTFKREDVIGNTVLVINASSDAATIGVSMAGRDTQAVGPLLVSNRESIKTPVQFDQLQLSWTAQPGEWVDVLILTQSPAPENFEYLRQGRITVNSIALPVTAKTRSGDTGTYGNVSVATAATLILAANSARGEVSVRNNNASGVLYLGFDSSVTTANGFPLNPGDVYNNNNGAQIYGVASTGTIDTRWTSGAA